MLQFAAYLTIANDLVMIVNYDCNHSFIVLAIVITTINYDHKTFRVQATDRHDYFEGVGR